MSATGSEVARLGLEHAHYKTLCEQLEKQAAVDTASLNELKAKLARVEALIQERAAPGWVLNVDDLRDALRGES
jgi:hypothetical protein